MRYMVRKSFVSVIGKIWMPSVTCAANVEFTGKIIEEDVRFCGCDDFVGDPNSRDDWENWLGTRTGDFQSIEDFRVDVSLEDGRDYVLEWKNEESEFTYNDCMYPSED